MKIGAIVPWFGSKRALAPRIVETLGPHRSYWELMAGSMAVLLAKEPARFETVVDLHGGLICLARVLADELACPWLYERLRKTLPCETLFDEADTFLEKTGKEPPWWLGDAKHGEEPRERRSDANMREYAYWYFIASWLGRNGTAGTATSTSNFCVRYNTTGGDPGTRFRSAVESIPDWHERLRGVFILRRDVFTVLEKLADEDSAALYVDPPYLEKSVAYQHDFENTDHARLAQLLRRFQKARVVVSYYAHPTLTDLYPGWATVDCARAKHLSNPSGKAAVAPEVLLVNQSANGGLFA